METKIKIKKCHDNLKVTFSKILLDFIDREQPLYRWETLFYNKCESHLLKWRIHIKYLKKKLRCPDSPPKIHVMVIGLEDISYTPSNSTRYQTRDIHPKQDHRSRYIGSKKDCYDEESVTSFDLHNSMVFLNDVIK